jgi:hypothetical protein
VDGVLPGVRDLFEPGEDAEPDPLVAAVADRGRRAGRVGDRLVGAAEPQGLEQLVEHDPVADTAAVATRRVGRIDRRALGRQGRELIPERVGQP